MARKNSQKTDTSGAIVFDSRTKAVMAQVGQDNVKEKVQAVKEVVPGRSNNEMILVLQYYDYCVESTIQAYLEDGAKEALKEWHFSENKVSKHKKKKSKKSQSNQKENQNQSADQQKSNSQAQANNNTNARLSNGIVNGHVPAGINSTILIGKNVTRTGVVVSSSSSSSSLSRGDSHAAASTSPKEDGSSSEPASSNKDLNDSAAAATGASKSESATDNESERHKHTIRSSEPGAASPIPDTYHGSQESSTNAADLTRVRPGKGQNSKKTKQKQKSVSKPTTSGLEKSSKDLHRQTVSLERLQLVLTEEVNKAYKRIKTVFEEMQSCLRERETWLIKEMDLVKLDAMETLKQRQQKAVDLKEEIDRASQLTESDVAELRLQIKQFVSDRRIDDDLGRTTRFTYDSDHLAAEIKSFGKVIAVNKCAYSNSSRPSTSVSVSSSNQDSLPPPIPAQVLSTSANISTESNDTNHVLSSEGATSKTIPNSDQETSQKQTEVAEPVQKENSPDSLTNDDQFATTNYKLIIHTEPRTFSSRRRPARKNYQNTGNRDYGSRGGSNQRGGGRGGGGGGYNTYPHERIQYLGRGVRRSRPYRGGGGGTGRGEMRGNYSPRPTSQRGSGRGEMRNSNYTPRPTTTQTVTTSNK